MQPKRSAAANDLVRQKTTNSDSAREAFLEFRRSKDPRALTEVFDACAQELLLVAHHLAARGVAPEDLLQATFLRAIHVADAYDPSRPLMPWLCGVLINVARAQNREHRREFEAWRMDERSVDDPVELAHAREFAEALRAAIAEFPAPQREVLTLRMIHGLSPTEIAHALGHPVGSVKSWIHRGVERLERLLPAGFAAALASIAHSHPSLSEVRARVIEAACGPQLLPSSTNPNAPRPSSSTPSAPQTSWLAKAGVWCGSGLIASLVVFLLARAVWFSSDVDETVQPITHAPNAPRESATNTSNDGRVALVPSDDATRSVAASNELTIQARFVGDGAPAPIAVRIEPCLGVDTLLRTRLVHTDSHGEARIELPSGRYRLWPDRGAPVECDVATPKSRAEIAIGEGIDVVGRVVDSEGAALGGARIWLSRHGRLDEGEVVATTDAEGQFELRDAPFERVLAVWADGWAASAMRPIAMAKDGRLDFTLRAPGDTVRGVVRDETGAPLAGATVMIGAPLHPRWNIEQMSMHEVQGPLQVESDAEGHFACSYVPRVETSLLWARAAGHRLHVQRIDRAGAFDITLDRGATWTGRVERRAADETTIALSVDDVENFVSQVRPRWADPSAVLALPANFELAGLPIGRVWLRVVDAAQHARTHETHATRDGVVAWSPKPEETPRQVGVVRSSSGQPLAGYRVQISWLRGAPHEVVTTNDGVFEFGDFGDEPRALLLRAPAEVYDGILSQRAFVRPGPEPLEWVVPEERLPSAFLAARVFGRDRELLVDGGFVSPMDETPVPGVPQEDGSLRCGPVPAGEYFLMAFDAQGDSVIHGPVEVRPGQTLDCGDCFLREPGRARIEVTNLPRRGPEALNVALCTPNGGIGVTYLKLTDGVGTSLSVPPGSYDFIVNSPQLGCFGGRIEVLEAVTNEVRASAPNGIPVTFTLRGAEVFAQMRVLFDLRRADGTQVCRLVDPVRDVLPGRAKFLTWNLTPGRYVAELRAQTGLRGRAAFEVPSGVESTVCEIELR